LFNKIVYIYAQDPYNIGILFCGIDNMSTDFVTFIADGFSYSVSRETLEKNQGCLLTNMVPENGIVMVDIHPSSLYFIVQKMRGWDIDYNYIENENLRKNIQNDVSKYYPTIINLIDLDIDEEVTEYNDISYDAKNIQPADDNVESFDKYIRNIETDFQTNCSLHSIHSISNDPRLKSYIKESLKDAYEFSDTEDHSDAEFESLNDDNDMDDSKWNAN